MSHMRNAGAIIRSERKCRHHIFSNILAVPFASFVSEINRHLNRLTVPNGAVNSGGGVKRQKRLFQ
jgi:hypothetical protein